MIVLSYVYLKGVLFVEKNFLELLRERLAAIKNNGTGRKILIALCAITLSLTMTTATACEFPILGAVTDPDTSTTEPGNTTDPDNSVDTDNSADTDDNSTTYSPFLTRILNDKSINNLLDRAEADNSLYSTPDFDSHPYTFLEKQSHDIAKIKSGEYDCQTKSFILKEEPNNLYIMTIVQTAGTIPYYTEYMLKYTLTDQEISDYRMLHWDNGHYYVQCAFANDAISATHTADIVSQSKMSVEAHSVMKEALGNDNSLSNAMRSTHLNFMLKDYDLEAQTFNIYLYVNQGTSKETTFRNCKIGILPLRGWVSPIKIQDDIFIKPAEYLEFYTTPEYKEIIDNFQTATIYNSQSANWGHYYSQSLNNK